MKTFIKKHQKIKAICRVIDATPQAFEDKPNALEIKAKLIQLCDELTELISKLLRPISTIHRPKQDSQLKVSIALQEYIGMGILIATHLENMPLLDILKVYKSKFQYVSAYKLYEIAIHVHEELQKNSEVGVEFGLTVEKLTAFEGQITDFGETLDGTAALLTNRKSGRNQLYKKLVECSKIVRMKLDPFIVFNEKEFPELYSEYMLVRGSRKRRKIVPKDESLTDISGIVTDSVTGLPIANATITVVEHDSTVLTDEDGYYLIDELEAGDCHVTCSAPNYEMPAEYPVTLVPGESVVLNFSLVPVVPQN